MLLMWYNERCFFFFFCGGSLFLFVLTSPRCSLCRDCSSDTAASTLHGVWVPAWDGHRVGGGHTGDGQSLRPRPRTSPAWYPAHGAHRGPR